MTKRFKLAGLLAALMLYASGAFAAPIPIYFSTDTGFISGNSSVANTSGWLNFDGWKFKSTLNLVGEDVVGGSTWKFTDGVNSLFGTLTGKLEGPVPLIGGGFLDYVVTGGTGLFKSYAGFGKSEFGFFLGFYGESGWLKVEVPEPGTTALFAVGLALIGVTAYRRRRAISQR
jgi:hypothetical protein